MSQESLETGSGPAPSQPPVPRFFISTDDVPERDRVPFFREELARIVRVDIAPLDDRLPRHTLSYVQTGPTGFGRAEGTPSRYVRTRRHLADSDDDFTFAMMDRGWEALEHNRRTTKTGAGDAIFMNNGLTIDASIPDGADVTTLRIDRRTLATMVRNPEDLAGAPVPADRPGLALLRGYLSTFTITGNALTPALLHTFGLHVVDLIAAILGATRDGAAQAEEGGVRAARLREVLSGIAFRAAEPGFGIDSLGTWLAVTPRYIQRLLEETGATFSEHVLEHRLRKAWRLLADPARSDKVAAIAYDCGFGDLSHFNRAFRRRFGETPTAVRGAATAPPSGRPPGESIPERLALAAARPQ